VLDAIKSFLVEKVIIAGITWIASLFSPVGALVKLVFTIWNLYTFVRDQLARVIQIAQTIVDGLANIARGVIENAALRVESALATLLPVAIDLVAKLLGLTGVTAKVREIIEGIREWIDNAINKLLDRVLQAFTGKGEPATAGTGETPAETVIGDNLTVDGGDGTEHHLTIAVAGTEATVMLQSEKLPVSKWLDKFAVQASKIEVQAQKADAEAKIAKARKELGELDPAVDTLAAAQAGGGAAPEKVKKDVTIDQAALRDALVAVFKVFGGKGAPILDLFATDIANAHEQAQPQIKKALRENEEEFQTLKWSDVRAKITATYQPFMKPILAEHVFGRAAQTAARAMVPEGTVFATPEQESAFVGQWVVRLIHSEGGVFATALEALRTILFEGGKVEDSAALRAAVAEAVTLQAESGDKPDPDLVAEVSGKIIPFLVAVARGDATFGALVLANWEAVYWGKTANQSWLKDRFRGSGGHHEWIPTNYVSRVIDKGRSSARAEDLETAAAWVTFQDQLRSPTRIVMYPPSGRYKRTAPHPRDPVSQDLRPGGALTVIQGHVGAVYAPVDESGYREDVIAQTQAQGPWHDQLRAIFDNNPGTDMHTMRRVVQEITFFISEACWFGDPIPDPGFDEYYTAAKAKADGKDRLPFAQVQQTAASAIDAIDDDITRARNAVGL